MRYIRHRHEGHVQAAADPAGGEAYRFARGLPPNVELDDTPAEVSDLLAPVEPTCIIGIGLNYRRHAAEAGMAEPKRPVVFFKSPRSVQHPGGDIRLPRNLKSTKVDYEVELAVVIGRDCLDATESNALDFVAGYTVANDVSARDWQLEPDKSGGQWSRSKGFDTFTPLGPSLVTPDTLDDPQAVRLTTRLNGETVQDDTTADMIFSVRQIIAFLSADTTLPAGTVILTGTPPGVGMAATPPRFLQPGDVVEVEAEGIGTLRNTVV
jgi:2-keto-4-pentenoate hydratase/2-oxohepta-3-ene-1,7-dioic acid hydratase in catechol pathway